MLETFTINVIHTWLELINQFPVDIHRSTGHVKNLCMTVGLRHHLIGKPFAGDAFYLIIFGRNRDQKCTYVLVPLELRRKRKMVEFTYLSLNYFYFLQLSHVHSFR